MLIDHSKFWNFHLTYIYIVRGPPTLPCKVIGVTENDQYLLGSKFGIINVYYSPGKIEPLGIIYFPELDNLPSNKISVREVARLQSSGPVTGAICSCKSDCNSNDR